MKNAFFAACLLSGCIVVERPVQVGEVATLVGAEVGTMAQAFAEFAVECEQVIGKDHRCKFARAVSASLAELPPISLDEWVVLFTLQPATVSNPGGAFIVDIGRLDDVFGSSHGWTYAPSSGQELLPLADECARGIQGVIRDYESTPQKKEGEPRFQPWRERRMPRVMKVRALFERQSPGLPLSSLSTPSSSIRLS